MHNFEDDPCPLNRIRVLIVDPIRFLQHQTQQIMLLLLTLSKQKHQGP